jgi:hypothetical protein
MKDTPSTPVVAIPLEPVTINPAIAGSDINIIISVEAIALRVRLTNRFIKYFLLSDLV